MENNFPEFKTTITIVGVIIGFIYWGVVFMALFSLNEQLSLYYILFFLGVVLNLPGVVLGAFKPKFGGTFLLFIGVVMLIMLFNLGLEAKASIIVFCMYVVPIILLGMSFFVLGIYQKSGSKISA
jgi:hypothetical protein